MLIIEFQNQSDAVLVFKQLNDNLPDTGEHGARLEYEAGRNALKIDEKEGGERWLNTHLIPALTTCILLHYEENWMKEIISDIFRFQDREEQAQILAIAGSIIAGEKKEIPLPNVDSSITRELLIQSSLTEVLRKTDYLSFESFLRFRLKDYRDRLDQIVEAAIDEYKLEQEYQNFIEDSRRFICLKKPALDILHLVHDKKFLFYNEHYEEIKPGDILHLLEDQFLKTKNIEPSSFVIAPLLSMAPSKLYVYTDQMDNGMIRTIQNIFQERVVICDRDKVTF